MTNKRASDRIVPTQSVLVKEDTGEIINYYHLKDISDGGMYLLKKISSKTEKNSTFTFLVPGIMDSVVTGEIFETRLDDNGTYGTAIKFNDQKEITPVINAIKGL